MSSSTAFRRRAQRPATRWQAIGFALFGLVLGQPGDARAQSEDQIKAAYLFNFARFVEWPESAFSSADAPIRICFAGAGKFASVVAGIVSGKQVRDRAIQPQAISSPAAVPGCHILYVGKHAEIDVAGLLQAVGGTSVFTVADRAGFARSGGIANFIYVDNKVRFEINPNRAKEAGLSVSSRLLRLATVVR